MKKGLYSIILMTAVMALGACKESITGNLKVENGFELNLNKRNKTYAVEPGTHEIKLELKERRDRKYVQLSIENDRGRTQKAHFNLPETFEFPKEGGAFEIAAADSGQNVDLIGRHWVHVDRTSEYSGWEGCWYDDWETVCQPDGRGGVNCYQRRIQRRGQQYIRYYDEVTERTLEVSLERGGQSVAQFEGQRTDRQRVYLERGFCH